MNTTFIESVCQPINEIIAMYPTSEDLLFCIIWPFSLAYYKAESFCRSVAQMNASEKFLSIKSLLEEKIFPTIRLNETNLSMHDLVAEILQTYYSNYRNKLIQV